MRLFSETWACNNPTMYVLPQRNNRAIFETGDLAKRDLKKILSIQNEHDH